jgi:hypothetical protein
MRKYSINPFHHAHLVDRIAILQANLQQCVNEQQALLSQNAAIRAENRRLRIQSEKLRAELLSEHRELPTAA